MGALLIACAACFVIGMVWGWWEYRRDMMHRDEVDSQWRRVNEFWARVGGTADVGSETRGE